MEKNNVLSEMNYQAMIWRIVGAVRRAAKTIPVFRESHNGCIRITIVPLSRTADAWLGGLNSYYPSHLGTEVVDTCEREFVFKIDPRGSHTIQWTDPEDGHTEPVNCYGYSALKTAWASKVRAWQNPNRLIEPGPASGYYTEENGWAMHNGAVYATVSLQGEEFMRLYVCTSGAKSSEDLECSLAGMLEAQEYFEYKCGTSVKFDPYIDGKVNPLEQKHID